MEEDEKQNLIQEKDNVDVEKLNTGLKTRLQTMKQKLREYRKRTLRDRILQTEKKYVIPYWFMGLFTLIIICGLIILIWWWVEIAPGMGYTPSPTIASLSPTTKSPTKKIPTVPTNLPTIQPTLHPTKKPSSISPSKNPTKNPFKNPTTAPTTLQPTNKPTTKKPTTSPTKVPTVTCQQCSIESASTLYLPFSQFNAQNNNSVFDIQNYPTPAPFRDCTFTVPIDPFAQQTYVFDLVSNCVDWVNKSPLYQAAVMQYLQDQYNTSIGYFTLPVAAFIPNDPNVFGAILSPLNNFYPTVPSIDPAWNGFITQIILNNGFIQNQAMFPTADASINATAINGNFNNIGSVCGCDFSDSFGSFDIFELDILIPVIDITISCSTFYSDEIIGNSLCKQLGTSRCQAWTIATSTQYPNRLFYSILAPFSPSFASSNWIVWTSLNGPSSTKLSNLIVSSGIPCGAITYFPTSVPTKPTKSPSKAPTKNPTPPTSSPTKFPTKSPTPPTNAPTKAPTTSKPTKTPSKNPTKNPTTKTPTKNPTTKSPTNPTTEKPVSNSPTKLPTAPTNPTTPAPITPTFSPTVVAKILFFSDQILYYGDGVTEPFVPNSRAGSTALCQTDAENKGIACTSGPLAMISYTSTDEIRDFPTLLSFPTYAKVVQWQTSTTIANTWSVAVPADSAELYIYQTLSVANVFPIPTSEENLYFWTGCYNSFAGAMGVRDPAKSCTSPTPPPVTTGTSFTYTNPPSTTYGEAGTVNTTTIGWLGGKSRQCIDKAYILCMCYQEVIP